MRTHLLQYRSFKETVNQFVRVVKCFLCLVRDAPLSGRSTPVARDRTPAAGRGAFPVAQSSATRENSLHAVDDIPPSAPDPLLETILRAVSGHSALLSDRHRPGEPVALPPGPP